MPVTRGKSKSLLCFIGVFLPARKQQRYRVRVY
jgi:hypothetical protein